MANEAKEKELKALIEEQKRMKAESEPALKAKEA